MKKIDPRVKLRNEPNYMNVIIGNCISMAVNEAADIESITITSQAFIIHVVGESGKIYHHQILTWPDYGVTVLGISYKPNDYADIAEAVNITCINAVVS